MEDNPYQPPSDQPESAQVRIQRARRRRKLRHLVIGVVGFVVLFSAYWGIRIAFEILNNWLFPINIPVNP
ncbi:MAG: hypothetical protein K8T91_22495 [Planctomycetes bacterium]|nr:hypothetical protein [Planctomycetota bacterium]